MKRKRSMFRRPQFALRTLVIGGLLIGTIAGLYGPKMVQSIRTWLEPKPINVQQQFLLRAPPAGDWNSAQTGYYESAETPLR